METKNQEYWKHSEQEIQRKYGGRNCGTILLWELHKLEEEKEAYYRAREAKKA